MTMEFDFMGDEWRPKTLTQRLYGKKPKKNLQGNSAMQKMINKFSNGDQLKKGKLP